MFRVSTSNFAWPVTSLPSTVSVRLPRAHRPPLADVAVPLHSPSYGPPACELPRLNENSRLTIEATSSRRLIEPLERESFPCRQERLPGRRTTARLLGSAVVPVLPRRHGAPSAVRCPPMRGGPFGSVLLPGGLINASVLIVLSPLACLPALILPAVR